jgi:hypothetical protein
MKKNEQSEKSDKKRRTVPAGTREQVLIEAGYKCGNPACRHILTLEVHHIVWVKDGGGDEPSNLLALCPNCHSLHTHGHISDTAISHWKGMLLALNHAFDRESMDLLLFLYHRTFTHWYSADGVLKFAGLFAAGLVQFGSQAASSFMTGSSGPTSSHQVVLSEKGKLLVEAWLAGDEKKYRELLAKPQKKR